MNQTIATILTGAGRSAIATVAVQGEQAMDVVRSRFKPATRVEELVCNRIYFGTWNWRAYSEELVVCRVADDAFEIHCHGGAIAANSILASLADASVSIVGHRAWLRRNQDCDSFALDALSLLPRLSTARSAQVVLDQARGAMRRELMELLDAVQQGAIDSTISRLEQMIDAGAWSVRLAEPFRVVLVGPPNSGKSSLMNRLLGYQRAIVFDQPGTTRDVVSATTALDGWAIQLSDTAGIRDTSDPVERAGISFARQTVEKADLVLWVVDLTQPETAIADMTTKRSLRIGTKADIADSVSQVDIVTSSVSGHGLEELCERIVERLIPSPPEPNAAVPICPWQLEVLKEVRCRCDQGFTKEAAEILKSTLAGDYRGSVID